MRLPFLLLGLLARSILATSPESSSSSELLTDSTTIYIQPVTSSPQPAALPLAEISYNPSTLLSSLTSFEQPELPAGTKLVRIGAWDAAAGAWKSSTSTTSAESFARGFRPTLVVSLDAQGAVLGVSIKSGAIDAGQTRDFAPTVVVRGMGRAKSPELNRPVVLSKEGKLEAPVEEKTFFQKYWMLILGGLMFVLLTGGNEK